MSTPQTSTGSVAEAGQPHETSDPPAADPPGPLEISALLHPTEHSRLLIALCASTIVFASTGLILFLFGGLLGVGILVAVWIPLIGAVWLALQVIRARLLGRSIRVTADSLPEIQSVLGEVRETLDYHRPVDVYVAKDVSPPVSVTSFMGTKILLLEGDLIGDLVAGGDRAQLTFLLARCVGALKARHERFAPVLVLITSVSTLRLLNPFLAPYYRATTYSGDQIGQVCCGSLESALAATGRLLVGKTLEPALQVKGVLDQADTVRRRPLTRLAQMMQDEPHLTNRYLNLLLFARRSDPPAWSAFEQTLDSDSARRLQRLWDGSHHQRHATLRARRHVLTAIATLVALAPLAAIVVLAVSIVSEQDGSTAGAAADRTSGGREPADPSANLLASDPTDPAASQESRLLTHVPQDIQPSCQSNIAAPLHAVASITCSVRGAAVEYSRFARKADMDADRRLTRDGVTRDLSGRNCQTGRYDDTWTIDDEDQGRLLCWKIGVAAWVHWTTNHLRISPELYDRDGHSAALYRDWRVAGPD